MDSEVVARLMKTFEDVSYEENGVEFWLARDLQVLLGYDEWRNFAKVVEKAKIACASSHQVVADHFVDVNKMVSLGSGSKRDVEDMLLTRYASYLIAQNGDPRKESIAFAQSYFAVQTHKQETLEKRIHLTERILARQRLKETETELSKLIYERGVDGQGFGRIRSKGDQALFGGLTTLQMKKKMGIPDARPLADFLPTITVKAKDLATEITNFNVRKNDLHGEPVITDEHVKNNRDVREVLGKSHIKPEELLAEEDIKKLQRQVKASEKHLAAGKRKRTTD
jgi:DNA-damage-inducible protein D